MLPQDFGPEIGPRRDQRPVAAPIQSPHWIAAIILDIVGLAIGVARPDVPVYLDAIAGIA